MIKKSIQGFKNQLKNYKENIWKIKTREKLNKKYK